MKTYIVVRYPEPRNVTVLVLRNNDVTSAVTCWNKPPSDHDRRYEISLNQQSVSTVVLWKWSNEVSDVDGKECVELTLSSTSNNDANQRYSITLRAWSSQQTSLPVVVPFTDGWFHHLLVFINS
jgi:hypothetical protein